MDEHQAQLNRLRDFDDAFDIHQARKALFNRDISKAETLLASSETLAHINYLLHRNELVKIKRDGIVHFKTTP